MDTKELLTGFFEQTPASFGFLQEHHNFDVVSGMARYERGRMIITPAPKDLGSVKFPFYATFRYETARRMIEINYGDIDFSLDCHITYDQKYRFSYEDLTHFFSLKDNGSPAAKASQLFTNETDIRQAIRKTGLTIEKNLERLLNPPTKFLEQALQYQREVLNRNIYQTYKQDMQAACSEASQSFREGNYKRTIMLYRPYRDHLSPEDFRIFSLALMRLDD